MENDKCLFCDLEQEECPGHDITTPTSNRFSTDEKFVRECQFDYEPSDSANRPR